MSNHYRLAARAYPAAYRADHFPELAATADELTDGRWSAGQAWSLFRHGLDTRCRFATSGSTTELWRSAIRLGLILALMSDIVMTTMQLARSGSWSDIATLVFIIPAILAVGFLAGNIRLWATVTTMTMLMAPYLLGPFIGTANPYAPILMMMYAALASAGVWWASSSTHQEASYRRALTGAGAAFGVSIAFAALALIVTPTLTGAIQIWTAASAVITIALLVGSFIEPRLAAGATIFLVVTTARQLLFTVAFGDVVTGRTELIFASGFLLVAVGLWQLSRRGMARLSVL